MVAVAAEALLGASVEEGHHRRRVGQPVAHDGDRSLVARDRVGTEDHRVVVVELEPLALADRHLGERSSRLALRPGAHDQGLLRIEFVEVFDVAQCPVGDPQDADVPGQFDVGEAYADRGRVVHKEVVSIVMTLHI